MGSLASVQLAARRSGVLSHRDSVTTLSSGRIWILAWFRMSFLKRVRGLAVSLPFSTHSASNR